MNQETLLQLSQELIELEKHPINGWDEKYPVLYNFLHTTVAELSIAADLKTIPSIVMQFHKTATWQAEAHLMTDDSMQIHIGAEFIRTFILNSNEQDLSIRYEHFKLVIAHELGHFCDQLFLMYGRAFRLRSIFTQVISIVFYAGLIGLIWQRWADFLTFNPLYLCFLSTILTGAQYIATIILFRQFEYNADKIAMTILPSSTTEQVEQALNMIREPIIDFCNTNTPLEPKTILETYLPQIGNANWYKKYLRYKMFHLHPSVRNRIKALRANK